MFTYDLWDLEGSLYTCFLKEKLFPERNGSELLNYELKSCKRSRQILWSKPWDTNGSFETGAVHDLPKKISNMRKLEGRNYRFDATSMICKFTEKKSAHVPLQERAFGTDLGQCLVHLRTLQLGSPFQVQFANHRDESLQMARLQNRSNRFKQKHLWICRDSFEMNLDLHLSKCYAAMHICCHCPFSDVAKSRCVQTPCSNPPGGRELGTAMGE